MLNKTSFVLIVNLLDKDRGSCRAVSKRPRVTHRFFIYWFSSVAIFKLSKAFWQANYKGVFIMKILIKFLKDEEGASMAEYALLLGLITVAAATVIGTLGTKITTAIDTAGQTFK